MRVCAKSAHRRRVGLGRGKGQSALHEGRAQDLTASLANARAACQKLEAKKTELDADVKRLGREFADAQRELAVQIAVKAKPLERASKSTKDEPQKLEAQGRVRLAINENGAAVRIPRT